MLSATNPRWLGRRVVVFGRAAVHVYTLALYVGCVAGTLVGSSVAAADGLDALAYAMATIALIAVAIVGARVLYVIDHWHEFRLQPARRRLQAGGAAVYGGLLLATPLSVAVLAVFGLPFWRFWDAAAVTMLIGLLVTKFGCLANGCCLGRPSDGPLAMRVPDTDGRWARRLPAQLLEAAWAAVLLVAVLGAGAVTTPAPGVRFAAVVGGYAAGRLVLEQTREITTRRDRAVNLTVSVLLVVSAGGVLVVR